jgi:D-alanyl-D-alanine endopeptidase (penicillin-binding protein 7)
MNDKARELGMENSRFVGPTGLDKGNVSTANDLVRMIAAARDYPLIRQYSTAPSYSVEAKNGREMLFGNTNPLVRNASWDIGLSKTGYIHESGLCLVMEANIDQRPVIIVLLNSWGKHTRVGDANRIKKWMERKSRFSRGTKES